MSTHTHRRELREEYWAACEHAARMTRAGRPRAASRAAQTAYVCLEELRRGELTEEEIAAAVCEEISDRRLLSPEQLVTRLLAIQRAAYKRRSAELHLAAERGALTAAEQEAREAGASEEQIRNARDYGERKYR